ncbi:MAG: polysaccharide pyruvyl transferase family protein [Clostridia bacterium]|nr:polysaccharide pyruvyl transferase family protein [Clostridia bacterium]
MNIGLMTWFEYHNYGTALQLTALNKVLSDLDNVVSVINYKTNPLISGMFSDKGIIKNFYLIYKKLFKRMPAPFMGELREKLFSSFLSKNLAFTELCDSTAKLEELNNFFDCFVCGSDQIWSPSCFDKHYFLDFVSDPNRMIAYAPSMSISLTGNKYIEKEIKNLTGRFKYISTREKKGAEIISKLIGKDVEIVLDPTLLLDRNEWNDIVPLSEEEGIKSDYILVYMLGNNKKHWKIIKRLSSTLKLKIRIVPVFETDLNRDGCLSEPAGPEEFIRLIRNASFVCTDSFHGMIFSVIYHKPFFVFKRFSTFDPNNQNSRVLELLNKLKLNDRLVKKDLNKRAINKPIDYDKVDMLLAVLVEKSRKYLNSSLNSVKEYCANAKQTKNYSIRRNTAFCTGCGVCATVCPKEAIEIIRNQDGFFVADVDEYKCINCAECKKVCPLLNCAFLSNISDGSLFSYKDNRKEILMTSASGGLAYKLSEYALENGYSVSGCTFDKNAQEARHIIVKEKSDLKLLQSSKYMQSYLPSVFPALFEDKQKAFVFGLPCQIAAVRNLRNDENLFFVDLICHGVPSYNLFLKYKNWLERKRNFYTEKLDVNFRYKPKGWKEIYILVSDGNKETITSQKKDPYFLFFENRLCYSKICYECPWRDKSSADIRIGDYWGPRFADDKTGVSMALALTTKGESVIEDLIHNSGYLFSRAEITDYLDWQDVINVPEPAETTEVISQLRNQQTPFKDTMDDFLKPIVRIKLLKNCYKRIKGMLK